MNSLSSHEDAWWDSHYGYMFLEDVRLNVMPIGGRQDHATDFDIQTSDTPQSIIELIRNDAHYNTRSLREVVSDWIVSCAASTLMFGAQNYFLLEAKGQTRIVRQASAPSNSRQKTPTGSSATCTLSEAYAKPMSDLRRTLRTVGNVPALMQLAGYTDDREETSAFDFKLFQHHEALTLAKATAFVGWNARNTFHPDHGQNAYYFIYRQIKFHAFMAMLRSRTLLCLNECLRLASSTESPLSLTITGLPSEDDAGKALEDWKHGQTDCRILMKRFRT